MSLLDKGPRMLLPVNGQPLHTRSLAMALDIRPDRRWRARGHVIDIRKTGFAAMPTSLQPAGLIHDMSIDVHLAPETWRIESLDTTQTMVAVEPSPRSGGECCRDPAQNLQALVGECIDSEFTKKISGTFGGPNGCSHLLALFFFLTAGVRNAIEYERDRSRDGSDREPGERIFQRSLSVDGVQNPEGNVELSMEVGDYHLTPQRNVSDTVERLEYEHDIRLLATVRVSDQVLVALNAAERERDHSSLAAAWHARPEWGVGLVGTPVLGGFAARVRTSCRDLPEQHLLLDSLLQLAPGHFQVLAAFADQWASGGSSDGAGGESEVSSSAMRANCYMWRPGGHLGPI